ncbi:MAG: MAPEG family protein [Hyphomicrobium sp.]
MFVLSRIVHAYIHTGSNEVSARSVALGVGALALIAMWVIFAARILISGA